MSWEDDKQQLEHAITEITEIASGFGLDFFPMRYEICPADTIYSFGAYGMPTRYNHWSFGKSFHRMKMQYDHGLSKIYELVINSDPCYAFLLDGNSLIQNKLIVAHVLAHSDFFKNNARFSATNRDMVESMSSSASRIRQYEITYGTKVVETFIDAAMAIQEHINPSIVNPYGMDRNRAEQQLDKDAERGLKHHEGDYDDLWSANEQKPEVVDINSQQKKFPPRPEKDLLWFIGQYSRNLKPWQQDVLGVIRDEMYYFWPQLETKIMNEGWASYWHLRIMREMDLTAEETIEFAKLNASVLQPSRHSLNPYHLGVKIYEDIERRYDRAKLFEVREYDMDTSFIRNYLTKELVEDLDLYVFEKQGPEWKITGKAWEHVREQLIESRINGGFPYLVVEDGDYSDNGEMYIRHAYEGIELDLKYVERTLPYLQTLWGKAVHLETMVEGKPVLFSYDGTKHNRKFLT
ncbi:MAG: SpoVR family protein [Paenibacillaceae bacterium]